MNTNELTAKSQIEKQQILSEAAHWLTLMDCDALDKEQEAKLNLWQQKSAKHQQVWQAAQSLQQTLNTLPKAQTLDRRALMRCLAYVCFLGPASYTGYKYAPWRKVTADYTTAVGKQHQIDLADGSQLWLNTNTIVSTKFTESQRTIILHSGEIFIKTNHNKSQAPFIVNTPLGQIQALGTEFNIRHDANSEQALISVQQHKVKISNANGSKHKIIGIGQTALLTKESIQLAEQSNSARPLWLKGELAADKDKLADFLNELSRYRLGVIQCHDEVANLPVSGLFQLANTDDVLQLLQQTLPINIKSLSRYWLRVGPINNN